MLESGKKILNAKFAKFSAKLAKVMFKVYQGLFPNYFSVLCVFLAFFAVNLLV
jgi:hypothetical protein